MSLDHNEGRSTPGGLFIEREGRSFLRQLSPAEIDVGAREIIVTPEVFRVNGTNETSLIQSLESLNGISISTLEELMRPRHLSGAGFLGPDEALLDILAADNDTVLGAGLTHQQLADFLEYFEKARSYALSHVGVNPEHFEFRGKLFEHTTLSSRGYQGSPFQDDTTTNTDHTLVSVENGLSINYSGLIPIMAGRYGFYEGKGTPYRVDPEDIMRISGLVQIEASDNSVISSEDAPNIDVSSFVDGLLGERKSQVKPGYLEFYVDQIIDNQMRDHATTKIEEGEKEVKYEVRNSQTGKVEAIVSIDKKLLP